MGCVWSYYNGYFGELMCIRKHETCRMACRECERKKLDKGVEKE